MKKIVLFFILMSALFAQTKTAIIEIKGMTCPLCTTAIKKSLKKTKGVIKAKVRLNTQKATVIFDDTKVSKKKLLDAVKNAGYSGKIVN